MKKNTGTGIGTLLILGLMLWAATRAKPVSAAGIEDVSVTPFSRERFEPEIITEPRRMVVEAQDGKVPDVEAFIKAQGVEIETTYKNLIQAVLTPAQINEIEQMPGVKRVREPMRAAFG